MAAFPLERDIDYPESDGRPLGETDLHRDEIVDLVYALRQRYLDVPDVYVAGNLFLYTSQGNRSAVVCPDVFLVRGVPKGARRTYKLWEEGRAPSLVIEVTSGSTRSEDLVDKKEKYARLGVEEYFLFDPLDEYLSPRLQGFRLTQGQYRRLEPEADGSLTSAVTGLRLQVEGSRLRLIDLATGKHLLRTDEEADARRAAEARADAAEEEIARLRRELAARSS
jgi:Uma2 family endonuclease